MFVGARFGSFPASQDRIPWVIPPHLILRKHELPAAPPNIHEFVGRLNTHIVNIALRLPKATYEHEQSRRHRVSVRQWPRGRSYREDAHSGI